jgi:hypothetical protein
MSLGWQTESALLPSKSKPINNVSNKSLLQLKNLIFQQEQVKKAKPEIEKIIRKRFTNRKGSDDSELGPSRVGLNSSEEPGSEISLELKIQKSLEAKAKLYDELTLKSAGVVAESNLPLIDFNKRKELLDDHLRGTVLVDEEDGELHESTAVSYEDQFNGSEKARKDEIGLIIGDYGPEQWQWSKGSSQGKTVEQWKHERKIEYQFQRNVEDRIHHEIASSSSSFSSVSRHPYFIDNHTKISKEAKIKTQWEKTLNSHAKSFLQEIHEETLQEREENQTIATTGEINKKRSLREEKLEMIKKKRAELVKK